MNEQDTLRLKSIDEQETQLQNEKAEIRHRNRSDLSARHRAEDEAIAILDRMSPRERTELYHTDREEWQRLHDAKEAAGMRKLFGPR